MDGGVILGQALREHRPQCPWLYRERDRNRINAGESMEATHIPPLVFNIIPSCHSLCSSRQTMMGEVCRLIHDQNIHTGD